MKKNNNQKRWNVRYLGAFLAIAAVLVFAPAAHADIGTAIDDAAGQVKGIFSNVSNLILMIGGVVGLVGVSGFTRNGMVVNGTSRKRLWAGQALAFFCCWLELHSKLSMASNKF